MKRSGSGTSTAILIGDREAIHGLPPFGDAVELVIHAAAQLGAEHGFLLVARWASGRGEREMFGRPSWAMGRGPVIVQPWSTSRVRLDVQTTPRSDS
jgi:hypothetical protein